MYIYETEKMFLAYNINIFFENIMGKHNNCYLAQK